MNHLNDLRQEADQRGYSGVGRWLWLAGGWHAHPIGFAIDYAVFLVILVLIALIARLVGEGP